MRSPAEAAPASGSRGNWQFVRRLAAAAALTGLGLLCTLTLPASPRAWEVTVASAGLLLPVSWAAACAVLIPAAQTAVFGVPFLTTDLPLLVCQMIALAVCVNFFGEMLGWNVWGALLAAEAAGLLVLFCAASIFGAVSDGLIRPGPYLWQTLKAGWPGMLLSVILVPPAAFAVRRIEDKRT